jgi:hypothetical protein
MRLTKIQFGSLLTYCPRGDTAEIRNSKDAMTVLKTGGFVENSAGEPSKIPMSDWVAQVVEENKSSLQFIHFFEEDTILVPIPRSSLMKRDSLWVPLQIAHALVAKGFGAKVVPFLTRSVAIPKSAFSRTDERPSVTRHFDSLAVDTSLTPPKQIILIDGVITRCHTIMGSANRLFEAFPNSEIRAFAALRTISESFRFVKIYSPCIGNIEYREEYDDTLRIP